ncbi:DMT family transporter [Brevirhabdus sp.]|uniref:DMT family transporter n=1 Tax=Brevirhabdus sp. TaxID=2004514 RepID=UPI00405885BF
MTKDRPPLGIALMIGFCVLAPLGDSIAKLLGDSIPVMELVVLRFVVQSVILIPLALLGGHGLRLGARVFRLTLLRTALHVAGIAAMFLSLRYLPLAEAVAIAFVMPFILLLLGRFVLNEEVGARRIAACAVGFAGTLLVIKPSFADVGAPALLPLVVAVVFALFMLVTRRLARDVEPVTLQATSGGLAVLALGPVLLLAEGSGLAGLDPVIPDTRALLLVLALGVLGTMAHLLMTWSLRFAPSATLAPVQYLEIPFATLIGWLVFRDFPDGLALLGIAVVMASGLYVVFRERALARQVRHAPPQP